MIINDIHRPFHDPRSLDLVLNILEDLKLDRLIINGDLVDFYNVNMHGPKHPNISTTLQDELDDTRDFLIDLRERFPDIEIVLNAGNHMNRLDRFILKHSKPFWNVVTPENHFNLESLDIEYHPYQYKYRLEDTECYLQHSPPSYTAAKACLGKKIDQTYIYGCTHREEKACTTGASGKIYAAYFNGWLGSTDLTPEHAEVFSYTKGHENWQQCFIIATVKDRTEFHINQYSIRDHKVCVDGYLYEG
jgi:hypothetical protein